MPHHEQSKPRGADEQHLDPTPEKEQHSAPPKPSQAEGSRETVDESLRRQETDRESRR